MKTKAKNKSIDMTPGLERSAILMLTLEEETVVEVFKHLGIKDMQLLSRAMLQIGQISNEKVAEALHQFNDEADQYGALNINSTDHVRTILLKTLGEERASTLMEEIFDQEEDEESGVQALDNMEPAMVAELIRDEHPQIIATIIIHLSRGQAADVLALFDSTLRNDILLRVATFNSVQPAAMAELNEVLGGMLSGKQIKRGRIGGVHPTAEILNMMNGADEEEALETLRGYNEELAQQIVDEMFVFANLLDIDGHSIQRLLQDIDSNTLVIALKGAPDELKEHFIGNMSSRAGELLREEMEMRGPIRLSQVEGEQKKIVDLARRLADSGEIVISKGEEAYV